MESFRAVRSTQGPVRRYSRIDAWDFWKELLSGGTIGRHEQGISVPELMAHGLARRVEGRCGRLLGLLWPLDHGVCFVL
jgi:hypothetical protein